MFKQYTQALRTLWAVKKERRKAKTANTAAQCPLMAHCVLVWPYTCVLTRTYCPNMNARESLQFFKGCQFFKHGWDVWRGICEGCWKGQSEVILRRWGMGVGCIEYRRDGYTSRTGRIFTSHFMRFYLYFSFYGVVFVLYTFWGSYLFFTFYGVILVLLILWSCVSTARFTRS